MTDRTRATMADAILIYHKSWNGYKKIKKIETNSWVEVKDKERYCQDRLDNKRTDKVNTQTQDIRKYLVATQLCDGDHPELWRTADEICGSENIPGEKAKRIFYFVRDEIRFGLAFSRTKASQTLKRGYGDCSSKSNLHVALLRVVGIPARLRWVKVKSSALYGIIMDQLYKRMPPTASHFWPECFLRDKWVSCEAFLDKTLYEGMLRKGLINEDQVPTIDWDGENDLIMLKPWIVEDCGSLSSADEALGMLQHTEEGMLPIQVERLIAPVFYPLSLRSSDRIRKLA